MPMTDSHREAMLEKTRGMAAALIEDLQHMREILDQAEPSRAAIRTLSVTLRRLLVNRELAEVANPRLGRRFIFQVPDNKHFLKMKGNIIVFFGSGVLKERRRYCSPQQVIYRVNRFKRSSYELPFGPGKPISLNLDGFLNQEVLCFNGEWANRRDTIQYVTIVAHGAHSENPKTPKQKLLATIASFVRYRIIDGVIRTELADELPQIPKIETFDYSSDAIDPVLVELLAAAEFTTSSDDTLELDAIIRKELA